MGERRGEIWRYAKDKYSIDRGTRRADSRTKKLEMCAKRRRQQKESTIRRERSKAPDRIAEKF